MTQMNKSVKQKQIHRHREQVAKGKRGGAWKDWESGIRRCKPVYTGWINNKFQLYNTAIFNSYTEYIWFILLYGIN